MAITREALDHVRMNGDRTRGLDLRSHVSGLLMLLGAQYLLGMAANLFISFPEQARGGALWAYAWSQLPVAAHIVLGTLILISAFALLVRALRQERRWVPFAAIGLVAVLAAVACGALFVDTQQDGFSYGMAVAFLAAITTYSWALAMPRQAVA